MGSTGRGAEYHSIFRLFGLIGAIAVRTAAMLAHAVILMVVVCGHGQVLADLVTAIGRVLLLILTLILFL